MRGKSVQKKNNGVENEKQKAKPKRQAHNIFCFFFLSLRNQRMWVPPAHFSPDHRDFHLCLKQRNEKRGNGSGVWVWAKTKQKLSNGCEMNAENRLQRVVYGVFIYFLRFFFFCFFFFCTRTPNSNNSHLLWIFQRGVSKNSTSSNPVNQVNNMWVQRFPLNYVPGVLQRSFRLDEACARRRRSWKIA